MPAFPLTRPIKDQYYPFFQKKVLFYQKEGKKNNDKMCALYIVLHS